MKKTTTFLLSLLTGSVLAQNPDSVAIRTIYDEALSHGKSYDWLRHLTKQIGPRLSGSDGAQKAVDWTKQIMEKEGFDRVFLQEVMVPHWVRGAKEEAYIHNGKQKVTVPIAALGGSVATAPKGVEAQVIEVKSFPELRALGAAKVKGKIVFFNRPMDPTKLNTFDAYGGAVDQRANGATEAAKLGAVGAIIRSMSNRHDDQPHTGGTRYGTGVPLIPTAAISTNGADLLSKSLTENPSLTFYFRQNCETLPDAKSYNVVGEIRGSEKPDEIIVIGGHLDSWDLAEGAHDDGSGCVQSIEVLRIMKALGIKPKRTLRAVMFMNEENGLRGGIKYADLAKQNNEKTIAAIESDEGGFTPRGFGIVGKPEERAKAMRWAPLLAPYGLTDIGPGSGGADIGPLAQTGTVLFGFKPDSQRYFDYHHTPVDRFEAVSQRELELGAASMAALTYLLDQYGL
ncbi:Zn-dependent M28 family amino/carboxypeptidase [Spirosoma oryzae]|uniref:Carboxypeptidase Q n=1 Tax=Spirosoma oryzae TaxID=1469603 RepID=A0A2T0SMM2_9BACT|nr:M28 family peptidase [Spirosoma oryzae]PRY34636.1 Zn-dependent M28 family amino/carboxypeptidase [Spirosoma oryzae]